MSCGCRDVVAAQHDARSSPGRVHRRLAPIVFINRHISRFFAYTWGMRKTLDGYLDEQLGLGRGYLTKAEAMKTLSLSATAFDAAAARLARQRRLASPKHGFYLILRPEDRAAGGPDPARWINPLMDHLGLDYRISLLRAAAFHGASHQAAQVFQVIVPKQLRTIAIDRQRIQFVYQASEAFAAVNKAPWLDQLKTDAGFAKVAGVGSFCSTSFATSVKLPVSMARHRSSMTSARRLIPGSSPAPPPSTRTPPRGASVIYSSTQAHSSGGQPASARPARRSHSSRSTRPFASWQASCAPRRPMHPLGS